MVPNESCSALVSGIANSSNKTIGAAHRPVSRVQVFVIGVCRWRQVRRVAGEGATGHGQQGIHGQQGTTDTETDHGFPRVSVSVVRGEWLRAIRL